MAKANTMDVIFVDYVLPNETEKQRVTLKEFLALPPDKLTEQNQKIQKALGQLYKLNDREPPLYHSFPKRKAGPLVINCDHPNYKDFEAYYIQEENKIELAESIAEERPECTLLWAFAHELKHAEQSSEEFCDLFNAIIKKGDGLAYHQLNYLKEAQAYAFGSYVSHLATLNYSYPKQPKLRYDKAISTILEAHSKGENIDAFSDIEHEIIKRFLPIIYSRGSYRDEFDLNVPISKEDTGLTEGEIPASFHFKQPRETLLLLQQMPQEARTLEGKELQFRKNHRELIGAIYCGSAESLKQLVEDSLKSGKVSYGELSEIIEKVFTLPLNVVSKKHVRASKKQLNFFLDLKIDSWHFMQEPFILKLLNDAHSFGRKDVEKAILDYQKENPDDKRFFKIKKTYSKSAPKNLKKMVGNLFAKMPNAGIEIKIIKAKER